MLVEVLELSLLGEEILAGAGALGAAAAAAWRRLRRGGREERSPAQLRRHYHVERELASRLRSAGAAERPALYASVYEELFLRVPDHPQHLARQRGDALARRRRKIARQGAMLRRRVRRGSCFMEIGAGDCALSIAMSGHARRIYAVEVSEAVARGARLPRDVELVLTHGCAIPVPQGSVDFAFSDQLMEHLHPDDAREQLAEICRSLAPGGRYFCITPNRLYGPRDISAGFDDVATGLHLREYSARELRALLREAGFSAVRFHAGSDAFVVRLPYAPLAALEAALEALPARLRRRLAGTALLRALLGLRVEAVK